MQDSAEIAVLGGSGLYEIEGLEDVSEMRVDTPFGEPSAPLILGTLHDRRVAFLARHGQGHVLSPSEVNYRANIYALKRIGVSRVISVSACGSLREDFSPGEVVVPDQLYDNTKSREMTFFGAGLVAHVDVADPFCPDLSPDLADSVQEQGGVVHRGGAYITVEGPRFSTRAESNTYRAWGMSIIGMTTSPEAFLAREAEMCYAVLAHVTDYDVWRTTDEPVTVEMVFRILNQNTELAKRSIVDLLEHVPTRGDCDCHEALAAALTTDAAHIDPQARQRLSLLVDKYLT